MWRPSQWRGHVALSVAAIVMGLIPAVTHGATHTEVGRPWPGEDSHKRILNRIYGGDFQPLADDVSFANGTVTAHRVADDTDQVWHLEVPVNIRTRAIFADDDQSLGYVPGESGSTGGYVNLLDADGHAYAVMGGASRVDLTHGPFRWARRGSNGIGSSAEADNAEAADFMVTYRIEGLEQIQPVHLLFFEDTFSDFDFQDLVVEVSAVPSPLALGPGLALLGAISLIRRRQQTRSP